MMSPLIIKIINDWSLVVALFSFLHNAFIYIFNYFWMICLFFLLQIWKGHSTVKQNCQPVSFSPANNLKSLTGVGLLLPLLILRILLSRESFPPQIKTACLPVDLICIDCISFLFPSINYRKMPIRRNNSLPVSRFVFSFFFFLQSCMS